MPLLSRKQYHSSMGEPMSRAGSDAPPPFDFWTYFDSIPTADFEGHDCSAGAVESVYRDPTGRYEHVLIQSEDRNTFMVLVLDLTRRKVFGHRLLDLNREYGLDGGGQSP